MITVGLIGTGRIAGLLDCPSKGRSGWTHAKAIRATPGLKLVSATNPDRVPLLRFARRWKIPAAYPSLEALLARPLPDIVSVCSPDATHFSVLRRLLSAERPPSVIFAEKPLCTTLRQLKGLRRLAAARKCLVAVNHTRRFDASHRQLAEEVKAGLLGRPLQGRMTYYGGWLHNGVHLLDLCMWLFGDPRAMRSARRLPFGRPGDPCLAAELDYGRFNVAIDAVDERRYQLFEGELRFTRGRVNYRDFGNEIELERVKVNAIGERELVKAATLERDELGSPLMTAYAALGRYVRSRDASGLSGTLLKDVAPVMERLFNAKHEAKP